MNFDIVRVRRAIVDLITTKFVKVPSWFTSSAALRVARLKDAEHVLVVDGRALIGSVTDRALASSQPELPVARGATQSRAWVSPETPVDEAQRLIEIEGLECLPVVSGALLLGIVTRAALAQT